MTPSEISQEEERDSLIFSLLIRKPGETVSGETLAQALGISRVALHKRIDKLRSQGVPIQAIHRKGYVLEEIPDLLIPPVLSFLLNTKKMGRHYHFMQETESTNLVAREFAQTGAPEGTLVVAESQTGGRGRQGRSWFSPKGENLYLSIILRPGISLLESSQVTFLISVALTQVIREKLGLDALIKWPNDIYIKRKKVAGILLETENVGTKLRYLIAGVGINVNTPADGFPPQISTRATSLSIESQKRHLRPQVLAWFLNALEKWYEEFETGNREKVLTYWREHNYTLGKKVHLENGRKGWAIGITPQGALLVRTTGGTVLPVNAGDVEVLG
jgi:BirA family biotin operon repressor/biotin-[acetyl-CoA-carboxylase] ligase